MALVAKNLGNTGSTGGNRVVWDFRVTGEIMNLDSEFPAATLKSNSAHQYGQAPGYTGVVTFSRIKSAINYGPDACTLNFTTATGETAEEAAQVIYDTEVADLTSLESDLESDRLIIVAAQADLTTAQTEFNASFIDLEAAQTELTFEHTRLEAAQTELALDHDRLIIAQDLYDAGRRRVNDALEAQRYDQTFESDSDDDAALESEVIAANAAIPALESAVDTATQDINDQQTIVDSDIRAVDDAEDDRIAAQAVYDSERTDLVAAETVLDNAETAFQNAQDVVNDQVLVVREALDRLNNAIADHSSLVFGTGYHEFSDIGGLPLDAPISNSTGTTALNSAVLTAGTGLVVEFRI